jgi:hypothetical protein
VVAKLKRNRVKERKVRLQRLQRAARDATHPVFSREALLSKRKEILKDKKPEERKPDTKRRFGSFNTSKYSERPDDSEKNIRVTTCLVCDKPHKLENCEVFLKKSVKERSEIAKSKGLCFLCLRQGYRTQQCKESSRCQTCKKPRATILHFERKNETKERKETKVSQEERQRVANHVVLCHSNDSNDVTTSSLIVPVWISH